MPTFASSKSVPLASCPYTGMTASGVRDAVNEPVARALDALYTWFYDALDQLQDDYEQTDMLWQLGDAKIIPLSLSRVPGSTVAPLLVLHALPTYLPTSNGMVTQWLDSSGLNHDVSATGAVTLRTETWHMPQTKEAISFVRLETSGALTLQTPVTADTTMYTVTMMARGRTAGAAKLLSFAEQGAGTVTVEAPTPGTLSVSLSHSGGLVATASATGYATTNWLIFSLVRDEGSWTIISNSVECPLAALKSAPNTTSVTLGSLGTEECDIAYLSLVRGALQTMAVQALHEHLKRVHLWRVADRLRIVG